MVELHNPADMPDVMKVEHIDEPWINASILVPDEYLGAVLKLCEDDAGASAISAMRAHAPCWNMNCRSMRWCLIFTIG